ncbi:APC family permease [Oceanibaculum indicum]|uniref:Amino acid transporter n=1 Tax=Oceanibaculum indicum TaxID=526216 RepID=A0A420WMP3_9PROT|nr:amino acid permease [Oceanibaculum indicum]RKQ72283.1 amino acid transporter [Oceanibaculum indicum]
MSAPTPPPSPPLAAGKHQPSGTATLSVFDAIAIMVGLVVGIGIFRTPSLVASNVDSEFAFIAVWVAGGAVTLIGALCYAELSAAQPHAGGEYHFLSRAYGKPLAMLFGWARGSVIQTGAIAGVAFVLGDYAAQLLPLGPYGPALYAAMAIILFTGINVIGTIQGKRLQIAMTCIQISAIAAIIAFGLLGSPDAPPPAPAAAIPEGTAALGLAMIFVLLTYGGWNEAAYLTGELKDAPRTIARVLVLGTAILVTLYVLTNLALLAVLGLDGLRNSDAVAADMMRSVTGPAGATLVSIAILVAAISTLNATIFTGARVYYAMARDLTLLPSVGVWDERGKNPANGLILQGIVALVLVAMGAATRDGFKAMVDYTAPVFWGFLLLTGLALFVLRFREPDRVLPYKVPFYPLTPILFCLTCAYMLHASIAYTGIAALVGLAVLAAGAPLLLFRRKPALETAPATAVAQESD